MKKVCGKVVFRDLEGGLYELQADDGERYSLVGGQFKDGELVTVEGEIEEEMLGIGMTGATSLKVRKVHR